MKYVIVYAHPNQNSFNSAVLQTVTEALATAGHAGQTRDLYALRFNPVLTGEELAGMQQGVVPADIAGEQAIIRGADLLLFIYPVWWFGMPAILKGYIDRVFSYGFAYDLHDGQLRGLLNGKKAMVINTTGGPAQAYEQGGFRKAVETIVNNGTLGFCGIELLRHEFLFAVPFISQQERKNLLKQLKTIV